VLLSALADAAPDDPRGPLLAEALVRAAGDAARRTTQEDAAALLALARWHRRARERMADAQGTLRVGAEAVEFAGPSGASLSAAPGAPWTWSVEGRGLGFAVLRLEGVPTVPVPEGSAGGCEVRRTIEAADGPLRQGRTYRVVLEGVAPAGAQSLLVTDVLPGGLEPEAAEAEDGTLKPDRVEVRDDRVLFFRTAPLAGGRFRQAYTVRAVTVGRFRLPSAKVEALYDPTMWARAGGGTVEVAR
jgi:hypothetical protein